MKLYLYDSQGYFLKETEFCNSITYTNSTEIAPDFGDRDREIYVARFDKFTQQWNFEYHPDYICKKATELDLEIETISEMKEADLRSGKLPALDKIVSSKVKEDNKESVRKTIRS